MVCKSRVDYSSFHSGYFKLKTTCSLLPFRANTFIHMNFPQLYIASEAEFLQIAFPWSLLSLLPVAKKFITTCHLICSLSKIICIILRHALWVCLNHLLIIIKQVEIMLYPYWTTALVMTYYLLHAELIFICVFGKHNLFSACIANLITTLNCPLHSQHHNLTELFTISQTKSMFCTKCLCFMFSHFWNFLLLFSFSSNTCISQFRYHFRSSSDSTLFL